MSKTREKKTNPLSDIPAGELAAELKRRQRRVQTLQQRHDRLLRKVDKLRAEIETLGGKIALRPALRAGAAKSTGKRAPGGLVAALKAALAREALTVPDAVKKVIEQGYRTTSANFRQIVLQTLARSDQFERVGRGLYKAK